MNGKKLILLPLLVLSVAVLASAQMIATGKLAGTVTDEGKAALPGVTVTISSPAMILPELATVTNEKGLYKFFSLPTGT